MTYQLHHANCLDALRAMPDNSIDSIVTDPPYGLSFMGKKWDYDVPSVEIWAECLRVLKPGGHLLAFAGTRTQHRMAVRIEDAGFEIRDMIFWCYASGFPKSLNVGKSIDREAGAQREVVGNAAAGSAPLKRGDVNASGGGLSVGTERSPEYEITAPATEAARQWQGWGTALKPALEPITVARKPLIGTVAANVLAHGTGALNIDACRVPTAENLNGGAYAMVRQESTSQWAASGSLHKSTGAEFVQPSGRWPANLCHDGSDEVMEQFPVTTSGGGPTPGTPRTKANTYGEPTVSEAHAYGSNTGSAARFFYCAKASRRDRHEGLQDPGPQFAHGSTLRKVENTETKGNNHPTVKPTDLMAYLCRLVTPPGGVVLDPFMGSGSTGKAAMREGFNFIGCELSAEYLEIARARIEHELGKVAAVTEEPQPDMFAA